MKTHASCRLIPLHLLLLGSLLLLVTDALAQIANPLRIICPQDRTNWICGVASTTPVNYPTPATTGGNCSFRPTVTCTPPSGAPFILGTTTVTCTATNQCGERDTCTFRVTVARDTMPPVIHCPSNMVVRTCGTNAITHYGVTATDNADTNVTINCIPPPGTPLPVGETTVLCTARDDCGNLSECTFRVRVVRDTTPPSIQCPSNMVFNCLPPGAVIVVDFFKPIVTDDYDPNPTIVCTPPSLVSSPGVHLVTCSATDQCGNSNRCQFTVTFNYDTKPPIINCPANMTVWSCSNNAVVHFSVTATDTCDDDVNVVCQPPSGSLFPVGTTPVVCTATDNATNRTSCTFTVTVRRDTTPPSINCPSNVVASLCSTCRVSQCVANVPVPIRPNSIGNGLFYGASVEPDLTFTGFNQQMFFRAEDGYHPIHVNAHRPSGAAGSDDIQFGTAWVRDDDSAFPYGYASVATVAQLHAEELAQQPMRPISLSGYKIGPNETRVAAAYLHDDSGYPWQLILDRDSDQYQAEFEALAAQGFRPISVSGYSFDGENPRFSGIFVQDGLIGDWVTSHAIPEAEYQTWFDGWWNQGFAPISLSAFTAGDKTFFTAVMVRLPNSGSYVARHGMTEDEFQAENANWTSPANEFNTTFRPLVVAAYRSSANGGAKRFAAVWRSSAPRGFSITGASQPSLASLDAAMQAYMQEKDVNAATLCVSKNGGIVLHRGYTWAPGEFKQTQPCSRFRIASASKALTATAIMKLLEGNYLVGMKGGGLQALTLETPVFQMAGMPDLPAAYGAEAQGITLRHLLQHRAGWDRSVFEPLYSDLTVAAALDKSVPVTREDMIEFMMTPGMWPTNGDPYSVGYSGPPGVNSTYSNFGYSILAQVIEVVSNQGYESFVRNSLLLPVGASHTRLGFTARLAGLSSPDEVTYTAGNGDAPRWYVSDANYNPLSVFNPTTQSRVGLDEPGASFPTSAYGRFNIHTIDGAGGWVATSDDLVRFLKSFDVYDTNNLSVDTPLLDGGSVWEMWTNPDNIYPLLNGYVLGWSREVRNTALGKVVVHSHGGNVDGVIASIARRSDGVTYAAMFSRETGGGAYTDLNNAIDDIIDWPVCPDGTVVRFPTPSVMDDSDPNVSVVCVPPSGSFFPLGSTAVTCTATDNCGNRRECTFLVTVKADATPPAIQCPTNRVVWTCSTNGAVVTFPNPQVTDDTDSKPSIVCQPSSGSLFPLGRSVVTCTAADECGNRSTCQFTIAVHADTVPPVIVCPTNLIRYTCVSTGGVATFPTPVATDNHDADPTIVCMPPSGSWFPLGLTTVRCVARDDCGNSNLCSFTIDMRRDTVPPVITCPGDIVVGTCDPKGTTASWSKPEAIDNYVINPQVTCTPHSGSVFPIGTTTVTCEARDACGNKSQCTFKVKVIPDVSIPGTDTNGDGLGDIWQVHFNAQGLPLREDPDRDGMTTAEEAAAGTDPLNGQDALRLDSVVEAGTAGADRTLVIRQLSSVVGKVYQLQVTTNLSAPWFNIGRQQSGVGRSLEFQARLDDTNLPPVVPEAFFRVVVSDVDEDGDGITAWEEMVLGTSDLSSNTHDTPGGDHQAALDWIGANLPQAQLREVALAHVGGSPQGPTQTKLVTATGTGGWLKLSSWTIQPATHDPVHLQDTAPFEGWNAKLHVLEPPLSPTLTLNMFVSGRIREDGNLWLSTRRVNAAGAHTEIETIGYGANASFRVYDYAMSHRVILDSGPSNSVDRFILITPVMGRTTSGQKQLRIVTWTINAATGDINGLVDSGDLGHVDLPDDGGRLQIVPEEGSRYVVSYLTAGLELSSWFFEVGSAGHAGARGGATSGLDIRGQPMPPVGATDFALGPLNSAGFVTALTGGNCSTRLAVWEDRVVGGDPVLVAQPFFITDNTLDQNPSGHGILLDPPALTDSTDGNGNLRRVRALVSDTEREETHGIGGGELFSQMPPNEPTNNHAASVTKCMTLLLASEILELPGIDADLGDLVLISQNAANTGGSFMGDTDGDATVDPGERPLLQNDQIPLRMLLAGMMVPSCNKSARAIAEYLGAKHSLLMEGDDLTTDEAFAYFVDLMNAKADALGMPNTEYSHPAHGGVTTPQDLVTLWREGWTHSLFRTYASSTLNYADCGIDAGGEDICFFVGKGTPWYPGLQAWKGGSVGWTVPGFNVPFCTTCYLGQSTRLDRSLVVALQQTGWMGGDSAALWDYGYQLLFTPDYRGGGGINTPAVTDFAVRKVHDTLAVSAVIYGADQLRLDAWQVVAGIGQANSLNSSSLAIEDLAMGTHVIRQKFLDVASLPTVGASEADYLTGHLQGGDLRLNVWRVAAEPGE